MKLDVYVDDRHVGVLEQSAVDRFVFSYRHGTDPKDAVSLLMPVRTESYISKRLHPFFEISLPEGAILLALNTRLAKRKGRVTEMDLLEAIGHNTIGRVRVVPEDDALPDETSDRDLAELLQQTPQFLGQWFLEERLLQSGVSGAFPKGLASGPAVPPAQRQTMRNDAWILKLDDGKFPALSFNEHWSMEVARRANFNTAATRLSDDMHALAVKRFDRTDNGQILGFEDFCALLARPAAEKYDGSVEKIIKAIKEQVQPQHCAAELTAFFAAYLCCSTLRNADAHLKNFGLLYSDANDIHLAPIYDMVTTSVYVPKDAGGDADDKMALTLAGNRRWLTDASIIKLGDLCGLTKRQRNAVENALAESLLAVSLEMLEAANAHPQFQATARRMMQLWSHGARVFNLECADTLVQQSAALQASTKALKADEDGEALDEDPDPVARSFRPD